MTLPRILLLGSAAIFIVVGALFLIIPQPFAAVLEIAAPTAMARTDLRATYGGLELGFGIFLVICVLKRQWMQPGLLALALATGGFAAGRLVSLIVEGTISRLMLMFMILEIVVTLGAIVFFRRSRE